MTARATEGARSTADNAAIAAAQAEAAEAEAAEAQALAAAAAARAKAARLRQQAEQSRAQQALAAAAEAAAAASVESEQTDTADDEPAAETADEPAGDEVEDLAATGWRRWLPGWRAVAVTVAVIVLITLVTLSGLMIWANYKADHRAQQQEEFAAGARQGVINLMSLNFNNGQADLQKVLDSTTGSFHDDFEKSQKDFLTVMQDSKVVTSTSVDATAVESMTDDSAVVLITATSQVANNASQQPTPRSWRLTVTVNRDKGQVKMSKVEFVP